MKTFFSFLSLGVALSFASPLLAQQSQPANPATVIKGQATMTNAAAPVLKMTTSESKLIAIPAGAEAAQKAAASRGTLTQGTASRTSVGTRVSSKSLPMPDLDTRSIVTPHTAPQHAAPQPVLPTHKQEPG